MWYETLPSLAVIVGSILLPEAIAYVTHSLFLGTPFKRAMHTSKDAHYYLRDMRVSGVDNAYKQKLLDCLPEEEEVAKVAKVAKVAEEEKPPCVCP